MKKTKLDFDNFPHPTKEDWLNKIKSELKTVDLSSQFWSITETWDFDQFLHPSEATITSFAPSHNMTKTWSAAVAFNLSNIYTREEVKSNNSLILNALNQGCNAIILIIDANLFTTFDWSTLFDGVNLNYIEIHFKIKRKNFFSPKNLVYHWEKFLLANYKNLESINGSFDFDIANLPHEYLKNLVEFDHKLTAFHFFDINIRAENSSNLQRYATELLSYLNKIENGSFDSNQKQWLLNKTKLSTTLGNRLLLEISKLRSIQLVWGNILKGFNFRVQPAPIHSHITWPKAKKISPYISLSSNAIAAILGGSSNINITGYDSTDMTALHIHHILREEAKLHLVADPLRGSILIEKLTEKLSIDVWQAINHIFT